MAVTQRRIARDDEEGPFDPRYPGKKIVADGGRVRVRLNLTDGRPDWMPPIKPIGAPMAQPLYDARHHRPRFAVVDASDPNVMAAERAYADHNAYLRDAWRTMPSGTGGAAKTTAPPADKPGESARDGYIRRLQTAYLTPPGQDPDDDDADDVEAQRRRWLNPGATPGSDAATATKDAAVADRDQAYGEYLDRISNGWRR